MLNERLKNLRIAKGLTLQQLGDVFGISKTSISSWESGKSHPDHKKIERLASVLGCSVQFLLTGEVLDNSNFNLNIHIPFVEWDRIAQRITNESGAFYVSPLHCAPGNNAFATRYPSSSNFSWKTSDIPAGSLLIVDPDETPTPTDTLIIQLNNNELALAKFVQTPENKKILFRIDISEFKPVPMSSIKLLGVVLEWQISGKLR